MKLFSCSTKLEWTNLCRVLLFLSQTFVALQKVIRLRFDLEWEILKTYLIVWGYSVIKANNWKCHSWCHEWWHHSSDMRGPVIVLKNCIPFYLVNQTRMPNLILFTFLNSIVSSLKLHEHMKLNETWKSFGLFFRFWYFFKRCTGLL